MNTNHNRTADDGYRISLFTDRTDWPAGPWDDEPDRIQWTDPATGLPCLVRRGAWCGYVGVGPDHPWHAHSYGDQTCDPRCDDNWCDHRPDSAIDVHGGLTYSAGCSDDPLEGICHVPEPGQPDHAWWFGFDCSHAWDVRPETLMLERRLSLRPLVVEGSVYRTVDYVRGETVKLARQLAERAR